MNETLTKDKFNQNLAPEMSPLFTDLYQLSMAYGYWKTGAHTKEAVFHLYFRNNPFQGGYAIACGLEKAIRFMENFKFQTEDLEYLATLQGNDGNPLFEQGFLDYLSELKFECDIDAVEEGTAVFPNEPLMRVQGPLCQCQLLESALLYFINFPTLIATKASRLHLAADGQDVLEFGMRRAQNAMDASRAAYVGGCTATSNVRAGQFYGIPVKGTHAHSWVMSWDSEMEAFQKYADAMPNNCVFLVDTYNTIEGVKAAIETGLNLRRQGHKMNGIRLDSGDLAWLSIEARKLLDAAGFEDAKIVASNDLDERLMGSLKQQGAEIDTWGIGTKLVTAYDQPALGGVYKLAAIREKGGEWQSKIKISEQIIKTSIPGIQQVRRFFKDEKFLGDVIFEVGTDVDGEVTFIDPKDETKQTTLIGSHYLYQDLLVPIYREGKLVYKLPTLDSIARWARTALQALPTDVKRFDNPKAYRVGLEKGLYEKRKSMVMAVRSKNSKL